MNILSYTQQMQDVLRKDPGVDGDAQRITQISWLLFLKSIDGFEKNNKKENYKKILDNQFSWDNWTNKEKYKDQKELISFINLKLFKYLSTLKNISPIHKLISKIFSNINNYMSSPSVIFELIKFINFLYTKSDNNKNHYVGEFYEKILSNLQEAGNAGEFYTPRALTDLISKLVNIKKDDKIIDFACGTGGFLISAMEHLKTKYPNLDTFDCSKNFYGVEKKTAPYLLCTTNLLINKINPAFNVLQGNMLDQSFNEKTYEKKFNVIITNPPFGATEDMSIQNNFPKELQSKDTADLFVILLMQILKDKGRAGIILPDGFLYASGSKERIRKKLLKECNIHTIVRLPKGVFNPYTNIATNIIFLEKGRPTKKIWYFQQFTRPGIKTYSKTKKINLSDFQTLTEWWKNKKKSKISWSVNINDIEKNNYRLDVQNPFIEFGDKNISRKSIKDFSSNSAKLSKKVSDIMKSLSYILDNSDEKEFILESTKYLISKKSGQEKLKSIILKNAFIGNLSKRIKLNKFKNNTQIKLDELVKNKSTFKVLPRWSKIPSNWNVMILNDVAEIIGGGTPDSKDLDNFSENGMPWLTPADLNKFKGMFISKGKRDLSEKGFKSCSAKIIPKGGILFSSRAPIGYVAISNNEISTNQGFKSLIPKIKSMNLFMYYFLLYERIFIEKEAPGTVFKEVSGKFMKNVQIPIPSIDEQNFIVNLLNDIFKKIDELIYLTDSSNNVYEEMEQNIFNYFINKN